MAETINRLSVLKINKLNSSGYFVDGGGLILQVSKNKSKSWIFKFDYRGKRHEMGLGSLATVNLKDAREKARICRLKLLEGINPLVDKKQSLRLIAKNSAGMMSFEDCANSYIKAHKSSWKNPKHLQQWENTIKTYAIPIIGKLNASDIETAHIRKILDPIWHTKTESAVRLRGRIETILDWAKVAGYREGENPARWSGHLEQMFPAPNKIKEEIPHPALPWNQISTFMGILRTKEDLSAKACEFGILTATRTNEIILAKWSEIDFERKIWLLSAERMKSNKEHRVALSTQVIDLLNSLEKNGSYIFKSRGKDEHLSNNAILTLLNRLHQAQKKLDGIGWIDPKYNRKIVMHGFRSTFNDWGLESGGFPSELIDHALAHKLSDKVQQAYQRGDMLDKRFLLMQAWADFCDKTLPNRA